VVLLKILYFDCMAGLREDMALGALLQAGVSENYFREQLAKLKLSGYNVDVKSESKSFLACSVNFKVLEKSNLKTLRDVIRLIESSCLSPYVKERVASIFSALGVAKAKVEGRTPETVVFENALPTLLNITGVVIAIEKIAPNKIMMSPLPVESGVERTPDGLMPLPSPLTLELLKGLPVKISQAEGGPVTPIGASLASVLVDEFGLPPMMVLSSSGYGKPSPATGLPNILRVMVGNVFDAQLKDDIAVLETNIDDMNPEFYPFILEKLLSQKALDVYLTSIIMKKGRPGVKLSVLCRPEDVHSLTELIIKETSSLGVRISYQNRRIAHRENVKIPTPYGDVHVKLARMFPGEPVMRVTPEYEDCRTVALASGIPINEVYLVALKEARKKYSL